MRVFMIRNLAVLAVIWHIFKEQNQLYFEYEKYFTIRKAVYNINVTKTND